MEQFDPDEYDDVFNIESTEIVQTELVPNLQVFRLLDEVVGDEKRLYHGYQIMYTGDPQMGLAKGYLSVTVLSETLVEVVVPCAVASFAKDYKNSLSVMRREDASSTSIHNAHRTATQRFKKNPDSNKFKYLLNFAATGEKLDNTVFGGASHGPVQPTVALVSRGIALFGKHYTTTDLYAQYNIARVETEFRVADEDDKSSDEETNDNLVEAAFLRKMNGMRVSSTT